MKLQYLDTESNIKNNRNLATSTNMIFGSTLFDNEEYYIRDVNLPGMTFSLPNGYTSPSAFNTSLNLEPDTIDYNPLNVNFLVDEDLQIWKTIINKAKMASVGLLNDIENDKSTSWIIIKDNNGNTRMKIVYKDCVISDISDMSYSSGSNDEELTFSVTLMYSEFIIEDNKYPKLRK